MATCRFSLVSVARYTSPIPPAPMAETISYGPRRVPGVTANPFAVDYTGRTAARTELLLSDAGFTGGGALKRAAEHAAGVDR